MRETIKTTYKEYLEQARHMNKAAQGQSLSLAVFRSCTLEPLEPVLKVELARWGFSPAFHFFGYNQFEQELLNPAGTYAKGAWDVVLFFCTQQEFFPAVRSEKVEEVIERLESFVKLARRNVNPRIILTTFDAPLRWHHGILDRGREDSQRETLTQLNRKIARMASSHKEVYVLDVEDAAARVGKRAFYDHAMQYHSSLPFSGEGLVELGKEIARIAFAAWGKTKKCVIVDLDNTLWGGVVGEEGAERVVVGPTGPGRAYYDFQLQLTALSAKGIVLAIVSKNNMQDVEGVFAKRKADMPLSLEDFVIKKIGWQAKPQSIQELAQELDIGLDSLVFLDDSPVERELVQKFLPDVYTPELPEQASSYAVFLQELPVFEKNVYSKEDFKKVQLYKEQGARAAFKQEMPSLEDFWRGLEMRLQVFVNAKEHIPRLAQMTQKTNQFNLTTRRYSELDMVQRMENPAWKVFSWSVQDRFGDNGIVGLMMVEIEGQEGRIDVFLQSCRVIGRTIEQAVMAEAASWLRQRGVELIRGEYIPTQKNAVAKDVYARLGFEQEGENRYALKVAGALPETPRWFASIEMKDAIHA